MKISVHRMHKKASRWWCLRNIILHLFSEINLEIQTITWQDRQGDVSIFTLCLREILCFTAGFARRTVNGVIVYMP